MPRATLLKEFRDQGDAVLFGTTSFWQGVDVRGEALSCVVIDKLPFQPPGDPLLAARLEKMRRNGENPFSGHQIPDAIISLKQGVGRLIRGEEDRGVLVLGDVRLMEQSYGRMFLESIPPMRITRRLEDVREFFFTPDKEGLCESSGC
jgi:ATP-dependent DNA helicase DinG